MRCKGLFINCIIADGGQVWPNAILSPIIKLFSNLRLQGEWHMITALHGEGVGRPKLLQHYTGWGGEALRNPKTKVMNM